MGLKLHIDELVLHGFAAKDRQRIAAAVEQELGRLLGGKKSPVPRGNMHIEHMKGGAFRTEHGAKPEATGTQIARTIYRGMEGHRNAPVRGRRP